MNSSADNLERCPQRTSILLIGSSGAGKSATINHLLDKVQVKTSGSEPETNTTSEILVTINDASDLTLGIIDTPGLNDPRGKKQDDCNLSSMKHFFNSHDLYSSPKCYPNLIFLLVSANDHRIEGNNSDLANTLRILKDLGVVDQHHPNVVAVLTFCCSVSHKNVQRWETKMDEKKNIISRHIYETLGIRAPVVLLENNYDDYELARDGGFTLLPNLEKQPENLYNACQTVLEDNGDHYDLSTFNACLANPKAEKQCTVARHKVMATDASKYPISEFEEDLFNVLRGSTQGDKLSFNSI
jgi:GTPase SAR1 family protein